MSSASYRKFFGIRGTEMGFSGLSSVWSCISRELFPTSHTQWSAHKNRPLATDARMLASLTVRNSVTVLLLLGRHPVLNSVPESLNYNGVGMCRSTEGDIRQWRNGHPMPAVVLASIPNRSWLEKNEWYNDDIKRGIHSIKVSIYADIRRCCLIHKMKNRAINRLIA